MSENSCPNSCPGSETKKTPQKISIEEVLKRDEAELNNQREQKKIIIEFISKFEADIVTLKAKLDKEKENTNIRVQKLKDDLNAQIRQLIDQTQKSIDAEAKVPLFDAEKLKSVKAHITVLQSSLKSINDDFKDQYQKFMEEFANTQVSTKQVLMNFTAQNTSETEETTKADNSKLQRDILEGATELKRQVAKLTPVEIAPSNPEYMEKLVKEKVYTETATDAHEVPEKVVRVSSYAAKWMLANKAFLN